MDRRPARRFGSTPAVLGDEKRFHTAWTQIGHELFVAEIDDDTWLRAPAGLLERAKDTT